MKSLTPLVMAPGPVQLHPQVQETLALPMIHHRTPEFDRILKDVLINLKIVFQTEEPVFILSSTGSGGMEALLVNCLHPGDKVLAIDSGKFGERWMEMASVFGAEVIPIKVPWGQSVDVQLVEQHLKAHPDTRIVMCQACETSTAVQHPMEALGNLIKNRPNTLFLVDGITALGASPLPMDAWHMDGVVGGSQKAFMLPTGLSFISFSKKAWARVLSNPTPRYYFDLRKELSANQKSATFFSSSVTLIRALQTALTCMLGPLSATKDEKLFNFKKHLAVVEQRAQFTRKYLSRMGLKLYSQAPAAALTAVLLPDGMPGQKLRDWMESELAVTVMGGQDQLVGKILRIGHMGHLTAADHIRCFDALKQALDHFGGNAFLPPLVWSKIQADMKSEISSHWKSEPT